MFKPKLASILLLSVAALVSGPVLAHGYYGHGHGYYGHGGHFHGSVGLYFGAPYAYGYPYYPPYSYYPPVVVAPAQPAQPQVYIEKGAPAGDYSPADEQANNVWYHCDRPDGYYPYIKDCPAGWKTVPATPPQ